MSIPIAPKAPILLVEDSPDDQEVFELTMGALGYENPVSVVESGAGALEYLHGSGQYADRGAYPMPALIFMDINLPTMSGIEALRRIRDDGAAGGVPVVMLTVSDADQDIFESFELDAMFYMQKPLRKENLADLLGPAGSSA